MKSYSNFSKSTFLYVLIIGITLYLCSGVLIGTFRWDEIYFLSKSWNMYKATDSSGYFPPTLEITLKNIWNLFNGNLNILIFLRLLIVLLYLFQYFLIFNLFNNLFNLLLLKNNKNLLCILSTSISMVILCSFRAFEIRPEIICNTIFLVSVNSLMKKNITDYPKNLYLIETTFQGIILIICASFSFRYSIPAITLAFSHLYICYKREKKFKNILNIISIWLIFIIYFNFFIFNFTDEILKSRMQQNERINFSIIKRLNIGGGENHLSLKMILFYIYILKKNQIKIDAIATMAIVTMLSYYLLLFTFDVSPYEYIRSTELIFYLVLFIALSNLLSKDAKKIKLIKSTTFLLVFTLSGMLYESVINLYYLRNSNLMISGFFKSKNYDNLKNSSVKDLVNHMNSKNSFLDQITARKIFCEQYSNNAVIVSDYNYHPICMIDKKSWTLVQDVYLNQKGENLKDINFKNYVYIYLDQTQKKYINNSILEEYIYTNGVYVKEQL